MGVMILFAFGYYVIWDTITVVEKASPMQYEEYKPVEDDGLTFKELQVINPEVFSWLTIYGTNVDYPLVQAADNEKYLTADSRGEYSLSGSIFMDYRNDKSLNDFNSIFYGHHMAYSAMFGDISDFEEEAFFDNHRYGNIYFDEEDHGIEFFAFVEADVYTSSLYFPGMKENSGQQEYLDSIMASATNSRDIKVTTADKIVLLSTCTEDVTNGRQILVGKITDEKYEDVFASDDEGKTKRSDVVYSVLHESGEGGDIVPLMVLAVIIIVLYMMIKIIIKRGNRRANRREYKE